MVSKYQETIRNQVVPNKNAGTDHLLFKNSKMYKNERFKILCSFINLQFGQGGGHTSKDVRDILVPQAQQ